MRYRASAKHEAEKLGITGHAHNKPDGSVEVVACGEVEQVEKLLAWMEEGPELADVTSVEATDMAYKEFVAFTTG